MCQSIFQNSNKWPNEAENLMKAGCVALLPSVEVAMQLGQENNMGQERESIITSVIALRTGRLVVGGIEDLLVR